MVNECTSYVPPELGSTAHAEGEKRWPSTASWRTRMTEVKPYLCSIPDAAAMLSVSRSKTYELIAAGDLATVSIGRRRLVRMESVRTLAMGQAA
jgi:excisionase family DNA binding protein